MIKGDGSRIVKTMQQIASKPVSDEVGVVSGKVIDLSPLTIQLDTMILTEEFLILGAMVQRTVVSIPALDATYREDDTHLHSVAQLTTSSAGDPAHTHTVPAHTTTPELGQICLWRGLEVGDIVFMVKLNAGQRYLVLQREEGIT